MIVVADTSPINYLVLIDCIGVLTPLYGNILIPPAVQTELLRPTTPQRVREWMQDPPAWLLVRRPSHTDPKLASLGAGEREAISLAIEIGATDIVLDDALGRCEALRRGLPVIGTLGVLVKAADNGLLDFNQAIDRLRETSFYLSADLLDRIRKNAK